MRNNLICHEKLIIRRHRCELAIEVAQRVINSTAEDEIVQATASEITNLRNPLSEGKFCNSSKLAGFAVRNEMAQVYCIPTSDQRLVEGTELALDAIKIGVELAMTATRADTPDVLIDRFKQALCA